MGKNKCPVLQAGEEFETYSSGSVNYISIITNADLLDREAIQRTLQNLGKLGTVTVQKCPGKVKET